MDPWLLVRKSSTVPVVMRLLNEQTVTCMGRKQCVFHVGFDLFGKQGAESIQFPVQNICLNT